MKSLIAFLLGYLAANWVASKGGIQNAISSVQTPTASVPATSTNPTVTNPQPSVYTPYRVFRIQ